MLYLTSALIQLRTRFARDEEGASMVEYGLLVALIAIVAIVALETLGEGVGSIFDGASGELTERVPGDGGDGEV